MSVIPITEDCETVGFLPEQQKELSDFLASSKIQMLGNHRKEKTQQPSLCLYNMQERDNEFCSERFG